MGEPRTPSSVATGAIAGATAWVVGLVLTYVALSVAVLGGTFAPLLRSSPDYVVALFSSLHLWPILFAGGLTAGPRWLLVPGIPLAVGGYLVAARTGGGPRTGAAVTAGYALPSALAVVAMPPSFTPAGPAGLTGAVVCSAVVVPLAFGAAGGWIASVR